MRTGLLVALICSLYASSAWADASSPNAGVDSGSRERLDGIAKRCLGRGVAGIVRVGMTEEQVTALLGHHDKPLLTVGISGGLIYASMSYRRYGATISLTDDRDGVLRVDSVRCSPLFD